MNAVDLFLLIVAAIAVQALGLLLLRTVRVRRELQAAGGIQAAPARRATPLSLRVISRVLEDEAGEICSLQLVAADGAPLPDFLPGQFITPLWEADAQGPGLQRCYSLSDRPGTGAYRISVKRVKGGRASNRVHDEVKVGDVLQARAPSGRFHLEGGDAPVVLVAGGIGITPMLSMLAHLRATQPRRRVWLLYGVRHGGEYAFKHELGGLCAATDVVRRECWFSAPREGDVLGVDYEHRGRIDAAAILAGLPAPPFDIYLCGPGTMMADLTAGLRAGGVAESALHLEAFGPASAPAPLKASRTPPLPQTVEFARSGKQVTWKGSGTLLELAERHGIDMPSACRAGNCGSCQTPVRSGEVRYLQTPDHTPDPGTCLPCICHPSTSLVLEA